MTAAARPPRAGAPLGCPHFPACPGCPWVGRPYDAQLASKTRRVVSALAAVDVARAAALVAPIVAAPEPAGYRVQAKLMVGGSRRGPVLGLYAPGTHRILDVSRCPLHDPLLQQAIPAIQTAIADAKPPLHGRGQTGLRYVLARASLAESRVLVTLVTSRVPLPGIEALSRRLRTTVPLAGLLVNENTTGGNVIVGARTTRVWGEDTLRERYGDVVLAAGPTAFVQANTRMAAIIYAAIADAAALDERAPVVDDRAQVVNDRAQVRDGRARVLDLYCGVGGIALTLSRGAASVLGIEEVAAAVAAATANAERGGFAQARFVAARVEDALAAIADPIDVVTLNPPRKGCGERVARELATLAPRRLLYLSCHPDSFARDAAWLVAGGFVLERVQPFDLLPQTEHVELLGVFRRSDEPDRSDSA